MWFHTEQPKWCCRDRSIVTHPSDLQGQKPTIMDHQYLSEQWTYPNAWNSPFGKSPFTAINWLMNMEVWWGVSPSGNSAFKELGNSLTTFLPRSVRTVVWWEICPRGTLDCFSVESYSIDRLRDIDWMDDKENILYMSGRKKRRSPSRWSHL